MPESSDRKLVLLADRFPNVSRMTLFRIAREENFPVPIIIRNKQYFDADELTAWEELRRRLGKATPAAAAMENT